MEKQENDKGLLTSLSASSGPVVIQKNGVIRVRDRKKESQKKKKEY